MRKGWHAISRESMKHQVQQSENCETTNSDPSASMGQTCIEMSNGSLGINTLYLVNIKKNMVKVEKLKSRH